MFTCSLVFAFHHTPSLVYLKFVNKFNHMSSCLVATRWGNSNEHSWIAWHTIMLKNDRALVIFFRCCWDVVTARVINLIVSYNFALHIPSSIFQRNEPIVQTFLSFIQPTMHILWWCSLIPEKSVFQTIQKNEIKKHVSLIQNLHITHKKRCHWNDLYWSSTSWLS